ncbi:MAG: hypothetical protein KAT14_03230 [Candidatus Marinimicrobia bacterium]|nr:hypothetical protein [Candidatus Neomarinimicrobiota bacterium]
MQDFNITDYYNKFKYGEGIYRKLMQFRVKRILLISTFYDAFIFERDALLGEQVFGEYMELNLSSPPEIETVSTGEEAIKQIKTNDYDLVITTLHTGQVTPFDMLKDVRGINPNLPIVLLLTTMADMNIVEDRIDPDYEFDEIFLWKGDANLFLAIIKSEEDKKNIVYDTKKGLIRVILLVEDSTRFYSMFLPLLYEEIVKQTQHLIVEELNEREKRYRMRARPKVLLAKNYEEACAIYNTYKNNLIAVFSDMSFERNGKEDKEAGLRLLELFRKDGMNPASVLMSSDPANAEKAEKADYAFLYKHSKHLLHRLREFIVENLGFGDFIFRDKKGNIIERASYLAEFEEKLQTIPNESIIYHARKNHFSAWLMARGEIELSRQIRKMKAQDFESTDAMRQHLMKSVLDIQKKRNRGEIIKFHPYSKPEENEIILLSEGSLGGKGRGLAFLNTLLTSMESDRIFDGVNIHLPNTITIGVNEYDIFIERNSIDWKIEENMSDDDIDKVFLSGSLSESLVRKLARLLERVKYPIAVRSSSLLEDSYSQPFAGIYRTYMLANNDQDPAVRLKQLRDAIKLIYASSYSIGTQQYIEHIGHQMDEEKMAVIIQEIVGSKNENYYYPHFSGVAQSYNFYPIGKQKHTDGMASLAVGLGKMVIEGGNIFRYCPKYPKVSLLSLEEMLAAPQREFFALDLNSMQMGLSGKDSATLVRLPISKAEEHGRLTHLVSVFDYENNRMWPGLTRKGPRIVTFDNILKYGHYPLDSIINKLLSIGEAAMGMPVEIEFAVDLNREIGSNGTAPFYLLQIRPLAVSSSNIVVERSDYAEKNILLYTEQGMGNGDITGLHDIIWCPPERFNTTNTLQMQTELDEINKKMKDAGKNYILIGPGRWGTKERFLGVPVQFGQISQAKVIVESGIEGFDIAPSQGTHFFHNIVAMQIGYFSIPHVSEGEDYINWDLLNRMKTIKDTNYFTHIRSPHPISVKMDGKTGNAIIYIDKK